MKNAIVRMLILVFTIFTYAQNGINYKALIKDGVGNLVASQSITIQFTILEGAGLTNVYKETHTPTTDANGIVIVNIGEGTPISGVFADIEWGIDSHALNTQINTGAGPVNMGKTDFKAVPNALYAETAGSVTEVQTLSDVVILGNSANNQLKSVTDPTDAQDAATKVYVDNSIAALQAQITVLQAQIPAAIGDLRAGGIVFWVNPVDNRHGLVCAIEDQSSSIRWNNGLYIVTGATGLTIGTGKTNTDDIIAEQGPVATTYAAGSARAYTGGGFNDWFLPSKDELNEMYINTAAIDATATSNGGAVFADLYWSSSELNNVNAYYQIFIAGQQSASDKAGVTNVRAVRAF